MRRQTPKQALEFEQKATKALLALGAVPNPDGWYDLNLNTIYGLLRLTPGCNSIRTRFDVVPKNHCLSGASFNHYSGKWNFEFAEKPSQEELDQAIENIRRIVA